GTGGMGYINCLKKLSKLGLKALEVEFTYGVKMPETLAQEIGSLAESLKISLSVHAPYYINLASLEKEKVNASRKRILDSCAKAHYLGATHVVFHAGFYQERDQEKIFKIIKAEVTCLIQEIKQNKWDTCLSLETTGKKTQFGSLDELLRMRQETGCEICVDFAHLLARNGKIDYDEVFNKLKSIKHIHAHFSGIEFTAKGERKHLLTQGKDIALLAEQVLKRKIDITIINESPRPLEDALKMRKIFTDLSKKAEKIKKV
ncbi:MAG: TIM barrel protein, partial [Candidatus Omnitrophica bacterium]|nr:TIM barrel protein [Candidatus Omnitrophota bacterium]